MIYDIEAGTLTGTEDMFVGEGLINAASGDRTYLLGYSTITASLGDPSVAVQGLSSSTFTMTNSSGGSLSGTMSNLPTVSGPDGGPNHVTWDRGAFVATTGDISPNNTALSNDISIYAMPFADAGGAYGFAPYVYDYYLFGSQAADNATEDLTLAYGDPYPASWTRMLNALMFVKSDVNVPYIPDGGLDGSVDAGAPKVTTNGFVSCTYPLADVVGKPIRPLITPPRNLQVNGKPGFQPQAGVGTQPTISWDPPAMGTPTTYGISVREIVATSPTKGKVLSLAQLTFTPTIRQVKVPSGILLPNHYYVFSLVARNMSSGSDAPLQLGLPSCYTNATSGLMSP